MNAAWTPPPHPVLPRRLARALLAASPVRPARYWADLLGSATLAWGSFVALFFVPLLSWASLVLVVVSTLAFLRAGGFLHELQHRSRAEVPGLHLAWDLLVGWPGLVPSVMLDEHAAHHLPATFATARDPEYAPVARWPRWRLLGSLAAFFAVALFLPLRWGLITPLSRLHPTLRRHAVSALSTADLARGYARPAPEGLAQRRFLAAEAACFAVVWLGVGLTLAGVLPLRLHLFRLLVLGGVLALNQARLLVGHAYALPGAPRGVQAQVGDAWTLGGGWRDELLAPIGFRFHALHHALPSLPYHAMPAAHTRLMVELPPEHPYRRGVVGGIGRAWAQRWRQAALQPAWPLPRWEADAAVPTARDPDPTAAFGPGASASAGSAVDRPGRRALRGLLAALVLTVALLHPASAPAADGLSGTWVLSRDDAERAAREAAIDQAASGFSLLIRGIARTRITRGAIEPERYVIEDQGDRFGMAVGDGPLRATDTAGTPVVFVLPERDEEVAIHRTRQADSVTSHAVTESGSLESRFQRVGERLSVTFTLRSARLSAPVVYTLSYRAQD